MKSGAKGAHGDTAAADAARRRFLAQVGALAAAAALPEAGASQATATADTSLTGAGATGAEPRYGLLIDAARCAEGCRACVDACNDEHGLHGFGAPLTDAQWIRKVTVRHRRTGREVRFPMMCQHCAEPPCVDVCPTGASFRRADGVVLVDRHTCIGCRYCMMACPFKARSFIHENLTNQLPEAPRGKGTVESCTLCVHRIDAGGTRPPACAEACAGAGHHAIAFGNLLDGRDPVAARLRAEPSRALRADLELDAGVRYQNI